jgi:hypothetical protein
VFQVRVMHRISAVAPGVFFAISGHNMREWPAVEHDPRVTVVNGYRVDAAKVLVNPFLYADWAGSGRCEGMGTYFECRDGHVGIELSALAYIVGLVNKHTCGVNSALLAAYRRGDLVSISVVAQMFSGLPVNWTNDAAMFARMTPYLRSCVFWPFAIMFWEESMRAVLCEYISQKDPKCLGLCFSVPTHGVDDDQPIAAYRRRVNRHLIQLAFTSRPAGYLAQFVGMQQLYDAVVQLKCIAITCASAAPHVVPEDALCVHPDYLYAPPQSRASKTTLIVNHAQSMYLLDWVEIARVAQSFQCVVLVDTGNEVTRKNGLCVLRVLQAHVRAQATLT